MTAGTGILRISPLGRKRQAMVRRWLDRAAEEMYSAPGVDKGFTAEETRVVRMTIDAITDQFEAAQLTSMAGFPIGGPPAQVAPLPECPKKRGHAWECELPSATCIRCVPMNYKVTRRT